MGGDGIYRNLSLGCFMTIFKIQIPLVSSEANPSALAYPKTRNPDVYIPVTLELLKKMKGRPKAFFYCNYFSGQGDRLEIIKEAPWQKW